MIRPIRVIRVPSSSAKISELCGRTHHFCDMAVLQDFFFILVPWFSLLFFVLKFQYALFIPK
jgi:hypothetical protein